MTRAACLVVLVATGLAAAAHATTIETFGFTESGYTGPAGAGVLTGSFTGIVEASGLIEQAELSSINVTFTVNEATGQLQVFGFGPRASFPSTPAAAPVRSISPPGSASAALPSSAPSRRSVPMVEVAAA
ncbi:MAG TPA: hypothetical protein VHY76_01115 [Acetobacteraceae bacterium]|jgi:hypothetical protein|nr:hypothetical protein [Acetobacteraceae bacterium]